MNSNWNNEVDDVGEEDSLVEVLGTDHTNEDIDIPYQEVMKENKKHKKN